MDPFIKLTTKMAFLSQQLQIRQIAYGRHQRVRGQVWNPHMLMDQVQCMGNPYLNTYSEGWQHYPNLSWATNLDVSQPLQVKESKLADVMVEWAKRTELEIIKLRWPHQGYKKPWLV